jgi:CheY-like chemotaxis protein
MNDMNEQMHVLIAEDDDDDFHIFASVIQELSLTIILSRAEDGRILLRILDEKIPDILFLDILMPAIDGRQCLKEIRANKKYDTLPIIIYSSVTNLKDIEFCYREGSNFYVAKPSTFAELKTVLEKIFSIDWKKTVYYPPLSQFVVSA